MTLLESRGGSPGATDSATSLWNRPLWVLSGQLTVVFAVVIGFGSVGLVKPKLFVLLMLLSTAGLVLLGPVRNIEKVILPIPVVLYMGWWGASYLWTFNDWIFLRDTQLIFPLVAAMLVAVSLVPGRDLTRALLAGCYVAIAWTVVFTLLNPGEAMGHPDGVPGWRGGFLHKNALAPFMLFAILTVLAFEERPAQRRIAVATAVTLVLLSQSTTSIVVGVLLLGFGWFLRRLSDAPPQARGILLGGGSIVGVAFATLALTNLPQLLGFAGKDPTLTRRTEIWAGVIEAVQHRPFTGYGVGGAWVNLAAEPTRSILRGLGFVVYHSHNGFLEVVLQLGLVGLALFCLLLVSVVAGALALISLDGRTATFVTSFCALVVLTSISEVTTFGIWLVMLAAFSALVIRRRRELTAP